MSQKLLFFSVLFSHLSTAFAASGGGVPAATVISQMSNLGILIAILFVTQRKSIAKMFKDKKDEYLAQVEAASQSKKQAEEKLNEVKDRVTTLERTFGEQIEEAKTNAEESYRSQLADAKNEAVRLKSSAKTSLEFEVQREIENLRVETFHKSAGMAEKKSRSKTHT